MSKPRTILVSNHAALIKHVTLSVLPYIPELRVIQHIEDISEIEGQDVIGQLPYHIAAFANSITVMRLDPPKRLRGVELNYDQFRRYVQKPKTYQVTEIDPPWEVG